MQVESNYIRLENKTHSKNKILKIQVREFNDKSSHCNIGVVGSSHVAHRKKRGRRVSHESTEHNIMAWPIDYVFTYFRVLLTGKVQKTIPWEIWVQFLWKINSFAVLTSKQDQKTLQQFCNAWNPGIFLGSRMHELQVELHNSDPSQTDSGSNQIYTSYDPVLINSVKSHATHSSINTERIKTVDTQKAVEPRCFQRWFSLNQTHQKFPFFGNKW